MNDQQLTDLFAAAAPVVEPPLPPGHTEQVLGAARRDRRRRRATAALAAVAALVLGGAATLLGPGLGGTAVDPAGGRPGLPDRIAGYSPLTGSVSDAPPGRALLLYGYGNGELFHTFQALVLGADGDVYRQLDAAPDQSGSWLLAPDGRSVVLADSSRKSSSVRIVDLATGRVDSVPLGRTGGVYPLALSPDGQTLAYGIVDTPQLDQDLAQGVGNAITSYGSGFGTLVLLNLRTGQSVATDVTPVTAVAFSPDGGRMAVQTRLETWLVGADGRRVEQVRVPQGYGITPHNAWSPDGTLLALTWWHRDSWSTGGGGVGEAFYPDVSVAEPFGVVRLDQPDRMIVKPDRVETFLGWLSGTELLSLSWDYGADTGALWATPVDGGAARPVSHFDSGHRCEYGTQRCVPYDVMVASRLLDGASVRVAGGPDRGPWPVGFRWAAAVPVLAALGLVLLIRRRRRRRSRGTPA
ncbi:hypothetical protein QEZ54_23895 [Catellatospora sp. KI3]|uniref:WD40 repeat domain-containing protein n=1 Tax=Catellatospora sp. KI3 TaxID=3041620 RepID=UPI00248276A3|nr:hypothetical protein [Catellatospora sp. KI3]MDI1464033.1 hypothetical protein [Catellatospora sp. KI3]